jgi:hypothetical protein
MHKLTLYFLFALGCCANTLLAAPITSPFFNDFGDASSVLNHTATASGQWSVLPSGKYQNEIIADMISNNESSSSMLEFTDLGGSPATAKDFVFSTVFTITKSTGSFNTVGFAILGNSANATTNASSHYLADVYVGGSLMNAQLRFAEIGPMPKLTTTMFDLEKILMEDIPYLLQVEGKYADNGDLKLKLELSGDNDYDFYTIDAIPANDVLQGKFFGYRDRTGNATSELTVEFDTLNITAIPEPSSLGIVAASLIGSYAIGRYWRRRQPKSVG